MALYYSFETLGWYDTSIFDYTLPEDAFEMTQQEWDDLRPLWNTGLMLAIGEDGRLEWVQPPPPPVEDGRVQKRYEFRTMCSDNIQRTIFSSEALGAVHNYDCRLVDQVNLQTRLNVANFTQEDQPIWTSDGTRFEWKYHSSAQLLQVMQDMNEHIKAEQVHLASKLAAVDAATTYAAVLAISY